MTLRNLVERERRGVVRWIAAAGITTAVCVAAALLAVGTLLLADSRWLRLPRVTPWLVWLAVIGLVAATLYVVRRRFGRITTNAGVARAVERERALRDGSVRTALEVGEASSLGRLGAAMVAAKLEGFGTPVLVPMLRRSLRRAALLGAALVVVAVGVLTAAAVRSSDGWAAVVHPVRAWRGTLLGKLAIEDAPKVVERGDVVTVKVLAPGRSDVSVLQRATGASWRETSLTMTDGSAPLRIGPLDADVAVAITDGRAWSDTVNIRVADRPFLGDVSIRAIFPAYLDRREEALPTGEPARIPRGTVLVLDGTSSTELTTVRLVGDGTTIDMTPNGRRFSGRITASTSARLTWDAVGKSGKIADVPDPLELEVLPDSIPTVDILAPGRDTIAAEGDSIGVAVLATDDHGLGNVSLRISVMSQAGDETGSDVRSLFSQRSEQWSGEIMLSTRGFSPGTTLKLVAVATDASPWKQTALSREVLVRIPTLSEMRDAARAAADSTVARANSTTNAQKALEKRTADAARRQQRQQQQANSKDNLSYESAEQAKNVAKEQREIADRVDQLQKAARELERQLKQAGALDSGLAARLRETQELLKQALTPELAEQLRKLEESAQQLSGEQAQKSLQDLAEQQRKLREQLEKSAEMLKRAALEGQMSTLKEEAKDLAEKQRKMAEQLGKQPQSAAEKQAKDLAQQSRDLAEDVKNLEQRLAQAKAEAGKDRVQQAMDKINEAARAMERAAQSQQQQNQQGQQGKDGERKQGQGQQGKEGEQKQGQAPPNAAGQSGQNAQQSSAQAKGEQGKQQGGNAAQGGQEAAKEAAEAMNQAADQLSKAREQQIGEWKSELTTELDRAIQEMLQLAREQRSLEQQAREGKAPNELRSQQSALQQGVAKASERLEEEGKKSSLLSQRSIRSVQDASKKVEDATQRTQAAQSSQQMATAMRDAGDALNQAAASLVRDRERAGEAKSASGFQEMLEQLQQMAKQQQSLNQSMMDLLPRMGDAQGKQQARALARQQREVAAGLEEAADRDNTGRAEAMAREARQLAQALESAAVDPSVLERQQRLFRKMLDAGLSLENEDEREDQGKREAKPWTGTEVYNPGTAAVSGKAASKFQSPTWNDLRGLTPEERRLVLEYFKRLNAPPEKQP
jgi:hypothetical protein